MLISELSKQQELARRFIDDQYDQIADALWETMIDRMHPALKKLGTQWCYRALGYLREKGAYTLGPIGLESMKSCKFGSWGEAVRTFRSLNRSWRGIVEVTPRIVRSGSLGKQRLVVDFKAL